MNGIIQERVINIVEKGENSGYQHLFLFPLIFSSNFFIEVMQAHD